jgi:hypothetical protein
MILILKVFKKLNAERLTPNANYRIGGEPLIPKLRENAIPTEGRT